MPLPMYEKKAIKNIVAIAAGKGGVGKSTVAVNLARALKNLGFAVGLMDTDIYGPSVRKMLPEDIMPKERGGMLIPALCENIAMLSMAYFRDEETATVVRAPIANRIITQFLKGTNWGFLDFLIIDFPPGTGDIHLTLCQQANLTGAIMVTTPQEVARMDVKKAINMFDQVQVPIVGVVENMSYYQSEKERVYVFGKEGGKTLAKERGIPFLQEIPLDKDLSLRADFGKTIFETLEAKAIASADSFFSLAKNIVAELEVIKHHQKECLPSFELTWGEF